MKYAKFVSDHCFIRLLDILKTIALYKLKYYNGFLPYGIGFRKSMYVWKQINEDRVQRNLVTIGQKQIVFPCCSRSLCVVFAFHSDRILKNPIKYTVILYVLVIFTPKHAIPGAASPITTTFTRLFFSNFGIYKESFTNHFVCMYICLEIHNNYYSASQSKAMTYHYQGANGYNIHYIF